MPREGLSTPITVLIVEDDAVTRRALSLIVQSEPTLQLVAAFDSVKPALEWLKTQSVNVLLTDLGLPDGSGIDIIHACARRHPNCDIMVITVSCDEENVLACIEAGASGYVLKDSGRLDLVKAIVDLRAGGSPMSPTIARMVLARLRKSKKPGVGSGAGANAEEGEEAEEADETEETDEVEVRTFTKREAMILDLIARGETYGEVAKMLSVSVGTVQTHIKNIYAKLSVHSRSEAVFEAHRRGLLQFGGHSKSDLH